MRQREFRDNIIDIISDYLYDNGMGEVADALSGNVDPELQKASVEAGISLNRSLTKLSRLAVRMGYIEKEKHYE